MKKYAILTVFIFMSSLSNNLQAQYPQYPQDTGNDFVCPDVTCYYQKREEGIKLQTQEEKADLEEYRGQQLHIQEEQLEETERQNELIEEQVIEPEPIVTEPE
jgi:hypothetical protein